MMIGYISWHKYNFCFFVYHFLICDNINCSFKDIFNQARVFCKWFAKVHLFSLSIGEE
jgi:hypothetical protein